MIDEAKFIVRAGDGGNGSVNFRREKFVPKGGPDGGDGGKGGSVYFETDPGLNTLDYYAGKNLIEAESGGAGAKKKMKGKDGADLVLKVPVGTQVYVDEKLMADLDKPRQRLLIAHGGEEGLGNWQFRSSTNTTPLEAEDGEPGEERNISLELKVLAQVGLVGLPNAGKSTLLSVLTRAKPKIGSYPFTTLEPNLGVMERQGKTLIAADIPGLIEGASEGKGLGIKFLKHIERCRVLIYVLFPQDEWLEKSAEELVVLMSGQLKTVQSELKEYKEELKDLPIILVVTGVM
ncbi:GTPase ObgE [Patescibacteria group bacterium]|nr:GTPase ObgE [Patescibacteria group bacterium]